MLGAIIGDTVGSVFEFSNIKTTDFNLFSDESIYTDDSIMTIAVAQWLLEDKQNTEQKLIEKLVEFGNEYPCPSGGYGGRFGYWLHYPQERKPYNSWGNGSAMRVSSVGWMFDTIEETESVAAISARVTHNHPEGIKGAQAVAAAIFLARQGRTKKDILNYISEKYQYNLSRTCDEIRPKYTFDESCQGTVPEAIIAFAESTDFETAIRLAISLGGDSDTLTCICGAIAEAFYKNIPQNIVNETISRLPQSFIKVLSQMRDNTFYNIMKWTF